jgi:hypothetical protein|tara:strand:- start:38761 stop:39348 length:588 start_codon:yes stop_codon:yes gene_type:complete
MKQGLFIVVLMIPTFLFAQDLEFLQQSQPPCRGSLISLFELSEKDSLSVEEAELAFQYAEKYFTDDVKYQCGLFTNIESGFLKKIILSSSSDSLVLNYIEYLKLTQNSAGEARSNNFEEIFIVYPETVIRIVGQQEEEFRDELIFHLAWGYLNNTYPESNDEPIQKFWIRHSKLESSNLRESQFVKDVIKEIQNL